jgi:hypothetical protein
MLTIFSSCTKEEPVDPCTNGFLDPGEDAPDCGGNCDPCDNTPVPYLGIQVNGVPTVMTTKSLTYDGTNWTLSMANDSLTFNFCLGSTGDIGSFAMPSNCTSAAFDGLNYPNQSSGSYAISSHDLQDDLMSGYFQVDFSRTGFLDTIHVTNGVFEFYEY